MVGLEVNEYNNQQYEHIYVITTIDILCCI